MHKPREIELNATYHVTARANLQEKVFIKKEDKKLVVAVIELAKKKYNFHLIEVVVMNNHIHLVIQTIELTDSLSVIMKWILSVIAMRYNRKYNRKGHLWHGRFKSKIVQTVAYFKSLIKYVANNPVKAKLAKDIFSYEYSGIYYLMHKKYHIVDKPDKRMLEIYPFLSP